MITLKKLDFAIAFLRKQNELVAEDVALNPALQEFILDNNKIIESFKRQRKFYL